MAFLPKPGEKKENDSMYEKSGDEDDRLRQEYESMEKALMEKWRRVPLEENMFSLIFHSTRL